MKRIFFLLLTVILGVEGGLRIFFGLPTIGPRLFVNESISWQRYWVSRHADSAEIYYAFDLFDPLLGWRNQPDIRNMPVYEGKFLNTNNRGFRGTIDTAIHPAAGIPRVAVLGDSFTFGDEVSDTETYTYFLQQMHTEVEWINMGVHGYGHDQMLLFFENEGKNYSPDIVLLGFTKIDMERNVLSFRDFAKPVFLVEEGTLQLSNTPVPSPEEVLRTDWMRPRLIDAYAIFQGSTEIRSGERQRREEEVTDKILERLVDEVRTAGGVPVFAYLPFGPEVLEQVDLTEGEKYFFEYCQETPGVMCFSTRPAFLEHLASGKPLNIDFHWDVQGHRLIAEAIHDFIVVETGLITP